MHLSTSRFCVLLICVCGFFHSAVRAAPPLHLPDTTPPGKPHFDATGAHVGEQIPDLRVFTLEGKNPTLGEAWSRSPTLLLTSSYSCPKSRSTYPQAAELAARLAGKVNVVIVYIIEAHPKGDPSPYSGVEDLTVQNQKEHIFCAQPRTLEERLALAGQFKKKLDVQATMYVDGMGNLAWKSLGGGPNMGVLVNNRGIVLGRQGWFDAKSMQAAADAFLAAVPADRKTFEDSVDLHLLSEFSPAERGDLNAVKEQLKNAPGLAKKVFPYIAQVGKGDTTLLQCAVAHGRLPAAEFLVENGADVNLQTEHVPAALHLAAKRGDLPMIKFLLAHHANINAQDHGWGPTPVQEALIHGHRAVGNFLMLSGAKSNFFTDAATGNLDAMRRRIKADRTIADRPDGWNRSPLAYAAAAGQLDAARLLIADGAADVNAKDAFGSTPLDEAMTANRTADKHDNSVIDLLRQAGAKESKDVPRPIGE